MSEAADEGVEAALEASLETDETKGELAEGVVLLVDDRAEYEARERAHCRRDRHRFNTRSATSWRITTLSAIIRGSQISYCSPTFSPSHFARCNGASVSAECSIVTDAPPDTRRFSFWTLRGRARPQGA
jgi:hypothetical protein